MQNVKNEVNDTNVFFTENNAWLRDITIKAIQQAGGNPKEQDAEFMKARFEKIIKQGLNVETRETEKRNQRLIKEKLLKDNQDLEPNYFYEVTAYVDGHYREEIEDDFVWRLLPAASVRVLIHEDADRDYAVNILNRIAGVMSKTTDWHEGKEHRNALIESLDEDAKLYDEYIPF
ncbi:MAG: hypothetical protein NTV66_02390 [Methylococcales bacterium]|nr:hypothetical protein [Methylococcales bacterium]